MTKLLICLNHKLSEKQLVELEDKWGVTEIVTLPEDLQGAFSQVTVESFHSVIKALNDHIENIKPDILYIQGQMGVVHRVLNSNPQCKGIFAFTARKAVEKEGENGEMIKTSIFEHQCFMEY